MGIFDSLRKAFGLGGKAHAEADVYHVYVRCRRCGEPLDGRVDLRNEPSLADDGETWIVRKGLMGSGENRCFQVVEVMLHFDASKRSVIESEATGGEIITCETYEALKRSEDA